MIRILQCCRYGKSIAELSAELECNLRTVYRDMEVLQSAGFPLYCAQRDSANRWKLLPSHESITAHHADTLPAAGCAKAQQLPRPEQRLQKTAAQLVSG